MTHPAQALLHTRPASLEELRELASAGRLYAVIDACDTPAVPEKARELEEARAVSLYRGSADEMYWAFAPYLFVVDGDLLDWIVAELWNEPWGIFAVADDGIEAMRRHFRRFLLVEAPDGEQWYFRFYDPRVLRTFLPSCSQEQLTDLFAGINAYVCAVPGEGLTYFGPATALVPPTPRVRLRIRPSSPDR